LESFSVAGGICEKSVTSESLTLCRIPEFHVACAAKMTETFSQWLPVPDAGFSAAVQQASEASALRGPLLASVFFFFVFFFVLFFFLCFRPAAFGLSVPV
jgi:hypothetical protein